MDTGTHSWSRGLRTKSEICVEGDCDGIKAQSRPLLGILLGGTSSGYCVTALWINGFVEQDI